MRAIIALLLTAVAGCSGTTPYRQSGENNLEVRSSVQGARASLHVHRLDAQCRTRYEGTVALDAPVVEVAVPADSLLVITFATSSFLGGSRGSISRELALRPRPGYRYRIDARYKDAIYDVAAAEIPPRGQPRALELGADCAVTGR
jgi:hypothetical protein